MLRNRDTTVDALRGLAVFTMVAANLAASVLIEPHPFWLRLYGSFAAPLFVLFSGMMVAFTSRTKHFELEHFMARGVLLVAVGALVDVLIWGIYPFTSVDVLYLISVSLPLAYLSLRLKTPFRWAVVVAIFFAAPLLQNLFGYTDYPTEFYLGEWGVQAVRVRNQTRILSHWVVDGWFPLFPWLGFSLLGVNLGETRWGGELPQPARRRLVFPLGVGVLALGGVTWRLYPGSLLVRDGYSELFYPPTPGYVLTAIGVILLLLALVDWRPTLIAYGPLRALGEAALLMYVLHLALIEYVIANR
jgi:uncharacterized membrane protein